MKRNRFSEEQIIEILKEHEAGVPVAYLCRKHGVSDANIYKWKPSFGGMKLSEAKRLRSTAATSPLDTRQAEWRILPFTNARGRSPRCAVALAIGARMFCSSGRAIWSTTGTSSGSTGKRVLRHAAAAAASGPLGPGRR